MYSICESETQWVKICTAGLQKFATRVITRETFSDRSMRDFQWVKIWTAGLEKSNPQIDTQSNLLTWTYPLGPSGKTVFSNGWLKWESGSTLPRESWVSFRCGSSVWTSAFALLAVSAAVRTSLPMIKPRSESMATMAKDFVEGTIVPW